MKYVGDDPYCWAIKKGGSWTQEIFLLFNGLSDCPGVTLSGLFYGHPHKIDASQVLGPGDKKVV